MGTLREELLKQGEADRASFAALSAPLQESLTLEVTALNAAISNSHVFWVPEVCSPRVARSKRA